MQTLYVTDLDGTLLNKESKINEKSLKIINDLVEQGMMFTYATARSFISARVVTEGLTLKMPVIVYNGALIINPTTKEVLSSVKFTPDEIEEIVSTLKEKELATLVYAYIDGEEKVSWLTNRENAGLKNYVDSRKGDKRLRPVTDIADLFAGEPFYFTCIGEKEDLIGVYGKFSNDCYSNRYRCTIQQELYRDEYWCEIMPAGATKAEAIKTLKAMYDCEKLISFGDAINDLPMFELSDEAYAVSNAVADLKQLATGIIDTNEEDGVAIWLAKNAEL